MNVLKGTLLWISQTDTLPGFVTIANLDPSAENTSFGSWRCKVLWRWKVKSFGMGMGIDMRVTKEKFVPPEFE